MELLSAALLLALAAAPAPVPGPRAETYLTEEQALRLAFPGAEKIEKVLVALTSAEREDIRAKIAPREPPRIFRWWVGTKSGTVLGYATIDDAPGKSEPITYMVAVDPALKTTRVEILAYRESHGGEVRQDAWREQFRGKDAGSPLKIGSDVRNIAGATISCRSITDGVRFQLACLSVLAPRGGGPAGALAGAPAAGPASTSGLRKRARLAMGTTLAITIHAGNEGEPALEAAFAEVERLESILSTWRPESEVSLLDRAAGGEARPAGPELLELLRASLDWSDRSGGAFDVTVGPIVELWRRAAAAGALPAESEIDEARSKVGFHGIELDAARGRVRLARPGAALDFGAIGKGYALDRAAAVLEAKGVHRALLDFGGQLLALDPPPGEKGWRAALRDPAHPDSEDGAVDLVRASISTSADYERGYSIGGRRISHHVDPRTGRPVEGMLEACVVCPRATDADALSTALFVMGAQEGLVFAQAQRLAVRLVDASGKSAETEAFLALRAPARDPR